MPYVQDLFSHNSAHFRSRSLSISNTFSLPRGSFDAFLPKKMSEKGSDTKQTRDDVGVPPFDSANCSL